MALRRYSARHDVVLKVLSSFVTTHLTPSHSICVDSVDSEYSFLHHISPTNLRRDVVWWSEEAKKIPAVGAHSIVGDGDGAGSQTEANEIRGCG